MNNDVSLDINQESNPVQTVAPPKEDNNMSLAFVQRLGAFAASILDTLPHSSAIIINLGIADQDMKEAYPPMAVTTILTTAVGTAAVAIFMSLFPSLP